MLEYENYHCHSMYSNCLTQPDSTMSIEDYAKVYRQRGQRVLCLSEHGNRSNVWKQAEIAKKYSADGTDMIPLAAAECYFVPVRDPELKDNRNFHLILIAQDQEGFYQLNFALSQANLTGFYYKARVDFDLLSALDYRHFICTTACVAGPVRDEKAKEYCGTLKEIFHDNFYLEIQHHPQQIQIQHNAKILKMYRELGVPLIYATDSHYIRHEDAQLRKELLLSSGIKNDYEDEFDLFLPTAQEAFDMLTAQKIFSRAQIEEAMENTLRLRDFPGVAFTTEKKIPNSRPDLTLEQRNKLYKKEVCDGYIAKAGMPNKEEAAELHREMDAVTDTGTADYFISMKDVVDEGIRNGGVLTTTGRGSGVSFSTNYALGFTSVNRLHCPVRLYPDRFISKERLASGALPDLDLNMSNVEAFEAAGKKILGEWGCVPMIAFGTCKTLSAFKLLARARNLDFETSNEVSKQIALYENEVKHAKENNQDVEDYNVYDDVDIQDFVSAKYLDLFEESKQYLGIVTTLVPHPCAHLLLDKDIRREIGVVRTKAKTGTKKPVYAAFIDGTTADTYGYLKADYLRVDVVKTIAAAFAACGIDVMPVDKLLEAVKDDKEVWNLYANGYTMGLNQVEQPKTTERVMIYKPKNVVELTAFVAAVRPGFKSMLDTYINRRRFSYNIPSLDKLLQTKEIPDSFLMFDEQILSILQAAGIPASDAYVCVKAIKKKKADKVKAFRDRFEIGFKKKLMEEENATEEEALDVVDKVWTIINDAASYMFCAAHAFSMACDSLYAAWLKAHYPYEFYTTLLKLYTEKGNKEKIALISNEMDRYLGIKVTAGQFGQDNRDWYVDKDRHTISQNLNSIKYISSNVANCLYKLSQNHYDTFVDLLTDILYDTPIDSRQIEVLITLDYFKEFGESQKLLTIYNEFKDGKNKITKSLIKTTVEKRKENLKRIEKETPDAKLSLEERLRREKEYLGRCISYDSCAGQGMYFVEEVESTYGVKLHLYNMRKGTTGIIRCTKSLFAEKPVAENDCLIMKGYDKRQRYSYRDGERFAIEGVKDLWIKDYDIYRGEAA